MTHLRTQIRNDVAAAVTSLATTGARVFKSRMRPKDESKLPCLLVTTNDEDVSGGAVGGGLDRQLQVVIRGIAAGGDGLDDTLDQIALEVETALANTQLSLRRVEIDYDDSLEKPVGEISLTFEILYFTSAGNPGVSA